MTQPMRIAMRLATPAGGALRSNISSSSISGITTPPLAAAIRTIHKTPATPATVSPIHGTGPPPDPPKPAADSAESRLERRKHQAALLQKAQDIRAAAADANPQASIPSLKSGGGDKPTGSARSGLLKKRFWQDVHVREVDGALEVHLDARPLRRPNTKEIVRIPKTKPLLAAALAIEWDMLTSAQQATKQHLIPLTSIVCRALDIADDDNNNSNGSIRATIAKTLLRYFDTDTLLCWAPPPKADDSPGPDGLSLRDTQKRAAEEIVAYLRGNVWPGVEIEPVLDGESIMPRRHNPVTRQIIEGWIMGLNSWELAGLERAVLAGKGLLGAARLVAEWSEAGGSGAAAADAAGRQRFGVEEAAKLASIEVAWQTGRWGEVEDTHDVEKEDLRRQFGCVVLLVGGTGSKS